MSRRVVVTGVGLVSPLGIGTEANWDALLRGPQRHRPDHALRRVGVLDADRGRGQGLRSAAVHREERRQEDGRLHPVRDRGVAVRDGRREADGDAGDRAARRRVHRARASAGSRTIEREHRALPRRRARARSRRSSFPSAIINLAAGQVSIRFGAKGPNSATCTACSASAHAIGDAVRDHPARRRRRDDRRRLRGGDHADGRRRVRARCARCRTRNDDPAARQPPVRQGSRRLRLGEGAGIVILEELEFAQAPRRADLRRARRLRHVRRRVPHHRASPRTATAPCASCSAALETRRRRADAGRLHQRARHLDAAQRPHRDAGDQARASATTPTSWRSRRPSR